MNNLTPELVAKAKSTKSADELFNLAKENGIEITEEEAKTYFAQLNANDSISDDELDAVAGGGGSCPGDDESCPRCGAPTVPAANAKRICSKCGYRT